MIKLFKIIQDTIEITEEHHTQKNEKEDDDEKEVTKEKYKENDALRLKNENRKKYDKPFIPFVCVCMIFLKYIYESQIGQEIRAPAWMRGRQQMRGG